MQQRRRAMLVGRVLLHQPPIESVGRGRVAGGLGQFGGAGQSRGRVDVQWEGVGQSQVALDRGGVGRAVGQRRRGPMDAGGGRVVGVVAQESVVGGQGGGRLPGAAEHLAALEQGARRFQRGKGVQRRPGVGQIAQALVAPGQEEMGVGGQLLSRGVDGRAQGIDGRQVGGGVEIDHAALVLIDRDAGLHQGQ